MGRDATRRAALVAALLLGGRATGDPLAGRPGLTLGEREPVTIASCRDLDAALADFEPPAGRIDLWVTGPLTLRQGDGEVWYLAVCSSPGVRVLCVTYENTSAALGDTVVLRGAFGRQDDRHVVLDPCLASPARAPAPAR